MTKIPKKIHYIWLGGGDKSDLVRKCIDSWKKKLPDYEIIEWNPENLDITFNQFAQEAFNAKKWAFAADVIRWKVLFEHGGIYLDSDVEVIKSFDDLLQYSAFTGYEKSGSVQTAVVGSEKGNIWVKRWLDFYDDKKFVLNDGSYEMTPNPVFITEILLKNNVELNFDKTVEVEDLIIFPSDYFSPKDAGTREIKITKNTYAIHHFSASWVNPLTKILLPLSWLLKKILSKFN